MQTSAISVLISINLLTPLIFVIQHAMGQCDRRPNSFYLTIERTINNGTQKEKKKHNKKEKLREQVRRMK